MRFRRIKLPKLNIKGFFGRHKSKLTFRGDDGKLLRRICAIAAGLVVLLLVINAMRVEPQLMNSPEVLMLKDRGVAAIGVRDDMPGFGFAGEGLEIELAKRLAETLFPVDEGETRDIEPYKLVTVNSMTVEPKIDDGTIDIGIAMMKKGASSAYAYSDAYYTDACVLIVKKGGRAFTEAELEGKTIGYLALITTSIETPIAQSIIDSYVEAHEGLTVKKQACASYDDIFTALDTGKVDAALLCKSALKKYRDTHEFTETGITLGSINYAIACSTDSPAFVDAANIMLDEMRADGTLDALYKKYGLE